MDLRQVRRYSRMLASGSTNCQEARFIATRLLILTWVLILAGMSQNSPAIETLRGSRLELVDAKGDPWFVVERAGKSSLLRIYDGRAKLRAEIEAIEAGAVTFRLRDASGKARVHVATGDTGGSTICRSSAAR